MQDSFNSPKLAKDLIVSKNISQFDYTMCHPAIESSKEGHNQDRVSNRFVADGIGSYENSHIHSDAAVAIYNNVFGSNSSPLPKNVLDIKIKAFNLQIQDYCKQNDLSKLKTTIVFAIPYIEDGIEKICMVSQGDSLVFGYTVDGKCEQLTLNSHPLFKNISNQNIPELTEYAIAIQQIIRDNSVIYSKNCDMLLSASVQQIETIDDNEQYKFFIESMILSSQEMLPETSEINAMKNHLAKISANEYSESGHKEIRRINKSLKLATTLQQFIDTKNISYLIKAYSSCMNVVNDFQTITHRSSSAFRYLIIASDGLSDNIDSKYIENILKIPKLSDDSKNQMLAQGAMRARIKPDNIASLLISIKQK